MTGVYYADIFEINDKGCIIMGYGKSKTCRKYTGESTVEITNDMACFEKSNNDLLGYSGYGLMMPPYSIDKQSAPHTIISYILRMLDEEETNKMNINQITSVNIDTIIEMCQFNINYGQSSDRSTEFRNLIQSSNITFLLVPWCDSMETKGNIISNYIK